MITGNELVPLLCGGAPVKVSNIHLLAATVRLPLARGGSRIKVSQLATMADDAAIPLVSGGAIITGKDLKAYLA